MNNTKEYRLLEIFFRALRGEGVSVKELAENYNVSTKSITRSINELKAFFADHRELLHNAQLEYSYKDKRYHLSVDSFLTNRELFALVEVMIGSRAFSKIELLTLVDKLKGVTTPDCHPEIKELIKKEIYHYSQVAHDCDSVQDNLWKLAKCISGKKEITIEYYRMDRKYSTKRVFPLSVMFTDYYFYLIAIRTDDEDKQPRYYRIDRIKSITVHRVNICALDSEEFDEGLLRRQSLLMLPGKKRTIRFEFSGPSVQAVLDKLPTAKIIECRGKIYILEAEVYGDGVKLFLLSQGSWVKVLAPDEFAQEMKAEIEKMSLNYK